MALPAVFLGAREFSTSVFNPIELQILAVVLRARSSAFSLGNTRYLESQGTYHWPPRPSMGLAYVPTLGWFTWGQCRHIFQRWMVGALVVPSLSEMPLPVTCKALLATRASASID